MSTTICVVRYLLILRSVPGEILACTKEWHAVTVGREPGVFSSE